MYKKNFIVSEWVVDPMADQNLLGSIRKLQDLKLQNTYIVQIFYCQTFHLHLNLNVERAWV